MRFFAEISYAGTGYSGWQIQANAPSIEEEMDKAFSAILKEKIKVTGAGRTDTNVNALHYIAHFDTGNDIILKEHGKVLYKINAILPKGIAVNGIYPVKDSAHARFSATCRTYSYFIHYGKEPFMGHYSWECKYRLDIGAMNAASEYLVGNRDFSCFEKAHSGQVSPVCDLKSAEWKKYVPMLAASPGEHEYLVFNVSSNRFLRNMVRAIVGTMIEIGRGRRSPEWMREVIESSDRGMAGQSVPGHALFLTGIEYPFEFKTNAINIIQ
ncbi:MAG TPA: tRNA pseudouridine(38-40) synthase TruA [Candidatus Coprenecus stercoripullorum]|nr:tRNA pseudouridine(38-40) synthase TruA [Candidatus Coprenecus stercoripullorum]